MRENYRWADSPTPPPPNSPETLSSRSWLPVDSVGKTEEAREKCECVERAGTKRPKRFFFFKKKREREKNPRGEAVSMCLPECGQREGVMTGFRGAARGQPAGQEERLRQQHDVIKEGPAVTHSLEPNLRRGRCTRILMRYLCIRNQ